MMFDIGSGLLSVQVNIFVQLNFFLTTPRLMKEKSQEKTWYRNLHRSDTRIGNATCISIHTLDTPHLKAPTPFAQDGDFFTPMHAHSFHYHDL